ncbi:MFS transporter [Alcaligenes sp. A-TC2]|uniref:MFS transporter n=1 Tax=Alcaligenes TaxID=507 RepID=UPI001C82B09F|nr:MULTISPECIES: MFS transporter [Alcaligenes]MBX6963611.1 MFS transporter [Providencia rettgeri]MBX7030261.1 MFS transporter [Alcaligenes faecalis]MCX5470536.1 MFS transporter [Alcaligenes nematophilus]
MEHTQAATGSTPRSFWKPVAASLVGNTLEWFDLSVYAYFALTISHVFFPTTDPTVSLVLAFATFGISFLIRPIGAAVIGSYADTHGRKKALSLSIILMLIGTLMIACMPSYATAGVIAPIGILIARLIQGFSAGGEFGSSTAFMMEHAPKSTRTFVASLQFASQGFGVVLASLFGYVLTSNLNEQQMLDWGWRTPFIFGLLLGPVGYYIRKTVDESPDFKESEPGSQPLREVLTSQKTLLLIAMGTLIVSTASNFIIKYMPSYAATTLHIPQSAGFLATLTGGLILTFATPLVGYVAGKISRIKIMLFAAIVYAIVIFPSFIWLNTVATQTALILVVGLMALLKSIYFAPLAGLMADVFPVRTRVTGMSLSYNIGVTVFGGFAPVIATGLISWTGSPVAPSYYLIMAAALSIVALLAVSRKLGMK